MTTSETDPEESIAKEYTSKVAIQGKFESRSFVLFARL